MVQSPTHVLLTIDPAVVSLLLVTCSTALRDDDSFERRAVRHAANLTASASPFRDCRIMGDKQEASRSISKKREGVATSAAHIHRRTRATRHMVVRSLRPSWFGRSHPAHAA
jgi:hypothetical protein